MSSYTSYLLVINFIISQILIAMPATPENNGRIGFAMLISLCLTIALLIKGGKEIWADFTGEK